MKYDEQIFKLCYIASKIYPEDKTPIEIFNNHLARGPFAQTVRVFTGASPQLKSFDEREIVLLSQVVQMMEKLREKTADIFSDSLRFCSNTDEAFNWKQRQHNTSGEKEVSNVFYSIANKRSLFKNVANENCVNELVTLFCGLEAGAASIIASKNSHFFTNNGGGKNAADELLSGKVTVINDVGDKAVEEFISVGKNGLRVHSRAKKFIITRSKLVELMKSKG